MFLRKKKLNVKRAPENFLLGLSALALSAHGVAHGTQSVYRADNHAPISVMGDHLHKKGEFMVSFRHMTMEMSGNQQGTSNISNETIVTTIPNNLSALPPTLRVVPQEMTTDMEMLGLMYAPTDVVTLMAMVSHVDREMRLRTFQGMAGTTQLGDFTTKASGFGDLKLGMLIDGPKKGFHSIHFNVGLSIPTGSIEESDTVLTPMNTEVNLRLPYSMQIGSGTHDVSLGATYKSHSVNASWGAQYIATTRLGTNDEGYSFGDAQDLKAWAQYLWTPGFSTGVTLSHKVSDDIDGMDELINAPVQTADPQNYGGSTTMAGVSMNLAGQDGGWAGHRLALEYSVPLEQDLNGVQMSMDSMFTVGYQYAF